MFRKLSVWLVLASYLFAGTAAELFHDHRHCCETVAAKHGHCHGHCHDRDHVDRPVDGDDHETDGDRLPADDDCVVCQFLAQAPLAAPAVVLILCGEIAPDEVATPVWRATDPISRAHPARGPPALS